MINIAANAALLAAFTVLASFILSREYRQLILGTLNRFGAVNAFAHLMLTFSIRFALLFCLFWALYKFR